MESHQSGFKKEDLAGGEDSISDEAAENQRDRIQEEGSWSAILDEADELAKTASSLVSKNPRKCARGRAKLKFSIRPISHREDTPWTCDEAMDGLDQLPVENSMAHKLAYHEQIGPVPSVAELLEGLPERNTASRPTSSARSIHNAKGKVRKIQFTGKKMPSSLGCRTLDDEDPPEFLGDGLSSEDEEVDINNFSSGSKMFKPHTMTDLFQQAFNAVTVEKPLLHTSKKTRNGFHGRLQQVLQIEKDRNLEFCKKIQAGCSPYNESRSINVHILSRALEAKQTVCRCMFGEKNEVSAAEVWLDLDAEQLGSGCLERHQSELKFRNLMALNDENDQAGEYEKSPQNCCYDRRKTEATIIFSSKLCEDVELGVGNWVRIHQPWKEVQVSEEEKIILCMHFSQVVA